MTVFFTSRGVKMTALFAIMFSLFAVHGWVYSQSGYDFAYIQSGPQATQIILLDAQNPSIQRDVIDYPISVEQQITYSPIMNVDSSGDRWIVSTIGAATSDTILIINIDSGITIEYQTNVFAPGMKFRWSPDGSNLAIITAINDADLDVYIYTSNVK
jgi:hypothetical protein